MISSSKNEDGVKLNPVLSWLRQWPTSTHLIAMVLLVVCGILDAIFFWLIMLFLTNLSLASIPLVVLLYVCFCAGLGVAWGEIPT